MMESHKSNISSQEKAVLLNLTVFTGTFLFSTVTKAAVIQK